MAGAKARAHARAQHRKTEPLDLQEAPRHREDGAVTRLRIVPVGNRSTAAGSGGTLQINCTVRPVHEHHAAESEPAREQRDVIYAPPVWSAPRHPAGEHAMHELPQPRARRERARFADVPTAVIPARGHGHGHGPNLADLQLRAAHALTGLQAGLQMLQSQGIDLRKWSKSSIAWTAALGVYALALFLIAILTS